MEPRVEGDAEPVVTKDKSTSGSVFSPVVIVIIIVAIVVVGLHFWKRRRSTPFVQAVMNEDHEPI